jgi:hypothetical protein
MSTVPRPPRLLPADRRKRGREHARKPSLVHIPPMPPRIATPRSILLADNFDGSGPPGAPNWQGSPGFYGRVYNVATLFRAGGYLHADLDDYGEMRSVDEYPANLVLRAQVTLIAPPEDTSGGYFVWGVRGGTANDGGDYWTGYYGEVTPNIFPYTGLWDFYTSKATLDGYGSSADEPWIDEVPCGDSFLFEVEISGTNPTTLVLKVNGAVIGTHVDAGDWDGDDAPITTPGNILVFLENSYTAADIALDSIEASTVAPGDFWTDFDNTYEFAAPDTMKLAYTAPRTPEPAALLAQPGRPSRPGKPSKPSKPALLTAAPRTGFSWDTFCSHLSAASIEATLTDPTNDNVLLQVKLLPFDSWRLYAYDYPEEEPDPVWGQMINGSLCTSAGDWPVQFSLQNTSVGPELSGGVDTDIGTVPSYAQWLANAQGGLTYPGYFLTKDAAFTDGVMRAKGIATSGDFSLYWDGTSLDPAVPMQMEVEFKTNPDAADKSKGYCGYFFFDDNGDYLTCLDARGVIDEWRTGFFDTDVDITAPDLPQMAMRAGLWMVRDGNDYVVRIIMNGAVVFAFTLNTPDGKFDNGSTQWSTYESDVAVADGELGLILYYSVTAINHVDWDGSYHDNTACIAVNLFRTKRATWVKPSAANTERFNVSPQFFLVTDPAYVPPLGDAGFWTDFDKTQEISA